MSREERIDRIKTLPTECIDDILMYADFVAERANCERMNNGMHNRKKIKALVGKIDIDADEVMKNRMESMI